MGKKINAFLGGLVATMALGAAVSLSAPKQVLETRANEASNTWYVVGTFSGENHWSYSTGFVMTETTTNTFVREKFSFAIGDEFKICDGTGNQWQGGWSYNNGDSSSDIKTNCFSAADDGANIVCNKAGLYTVTFTKSDYHIKIEEVSVTTYTVRKHAVFNDLNKTIDDTIYVSEVVAEGTEYAAPSSITVGGYVFDGWYYDEYFNVQFTSEIITEDLDIYAKYDLSFPDHLFFYVTGSEEVPDTYIYTFGGSEQYGAWPGTKLTKIGGLIEAHGVLAFEGTSQLIYLLPVLSSANDTHVIIHDNKGTQTGDMPLNAGYAYWFGDGYQKGSDTAGSAIGFLLEVEDIRNIFSSGKYDHSVCGIPAEIAADLWNQYYGYDDDIKKMIDNSTTWTYSKTAVEDGTEEETVISYKDVMAQLYIIAVNGGQTVSGSLSTITKPVTFDNSTKNNITLVIIILSVAAITALGAYLFIDKKRSHK